MIDTSGFVLFAIHCAVGALFGYFLGRYARYVVQKQKAGDDATQVQILSVKQNSDGGTE